MCLRGLHCGREGEVEICCTRDRCGYVIMARLCWLVQKSLEERFPNLFSTDTPLQKHELTQVAICPTCLERKERNLSCFLIEACGVHALQLKEEHNCRYHPEAIPLHDLVPECPWKSYSMCWVIVIEKSIKYTCSWTHAFYLQVPQLNLGLLVIN